MCACVCVNTCVCVQVFVYVNEGVWVGMCKKEDEMV